MVVKGIPVSLNRTTYVAAAAGRKALDNAETEQCSSRCQFPISMDLERCFDNTTATDSIHVCKHGNLQLRTQFINLYSAVQQCVLYLKD